MRDSRVRLVIACALAMGAAHAADWCKGCVAIVESVSGRATVREHGAKGGTPAARLELLAAGCTIEVGADAQSKVTVFLANGKHYQLDAGARATVTANALTGTKGSVQPLAPLPAIPPIAGPHPPTMGVTRFRGATLRDLYPRDDMAVLPGPVMLTFRPPPDASGYQVHVEDEQKNTVFDLPTKSSDILIPDGILKPGRWYKWHIVATRPAGEIERAEAIFMVLSEENLARRTAFAKAAQESSGQAAALCLLADIDYRTGLLREARDEFKAALKLQPEEASIRRALESVQAALSGAPQ